MRRKDGQHLPAPRVDEQGSAMRRGAGNRAPGRGNAFIHTLQGLDELAASGALVSIHVRDLDTAAVVLAGDDHISRPIAGVGAVPVLLAAAAAFLSGSLDARAVVHRRDVSPSVTGGLWEHLDDVPLTLGDLAVLSASVNDPGAMNVLLHRLRTAGVNDLLATAGYSEIAVLDGHRDVRHPDDAPHTAVGTTRELARLMASIADGKAVSAAVSAQTGEWLTLGSDLSMVGAGTGLDPFDHDEDRHGLLFFNKTGRTEVVRCEAGVIAGPRAGVAYAITVCFDDLSVAHRLRVARVMRVFGDELMEFVH